MRIGINATVGDERPTGLGIYAARIVRELLKHDADSLVVYGTAAGTTSLPARIVRRVSPRTAPRLGVRGHLARLLWINTVLPVRVWRDGCTLLFTPCPEPMLVSSIPQVCVVHDLIALRFPHYFPRLRLYFRLLRMLLRACSAVIVDSEATRRDVRTLLGVPETRLHVVYPGYDRERYRLGVDASTIIRRHALDRYVLYVGNLLPHKNVPGLLRAFAAIAPRVPHRLVIAGFRDPRMTPALDREIARLKLEARVLFLDYVPVDDLPAIYAGADVCVQPSLYEGFGLTILEAMACGSPVVASRGGAQPEVGGDAAVWVEPGDVEALAVAVERVVSSPDLRADLRARGLRRVEDFSWERAGCRVREILSNVGKTGR